MIIIENNMVKTHVFRRWMLGPISGLSCLSHSGLWRDCRKRQHFTAYLVGQGKVIRVWIKVMVVEIEYDNSQPISLGNKMYFSWNKCSHHQRGVICKESASSFITLWDSECISGVSGCLGLCFWNQGRPHNREGSFRHWASGQCSDRCGFRVAQPLN